MIAGIGKLPDTLRDRAIVLKMKRRTREETVHKWRTGQADALTDLRSKCLRWAQDHLSTLGNATPAVPDALHDRAADNWATLCAIAKEAGGDWPALVRKAIAKLEGLDDIDDENPAILLLQDLAEIFEKKKHPKLPTADILSELHSREDRPWPEWGKQRKPITARQLALLLAPFEVKPKTIRPDQDSTAKGYERTDFADVFSRYIHSSSVTPSQTSNDADFSQNASVTKDPVLRRGKTRKPMPDNTCDGVTDEKGGSENKTRFSPILPVRKRDALDP